MFWLIILCLIFHTLIHEQAKREPSISFSDFPFIWKQLHSSLGNKCDMVAEQIRSGNKEGMKQLTFSTPLSGFSFEKPFGLAFFAVSCEAPMLTLWHTVIWIVSAGGSPSLTSRNVAQASFVDPLSFKIIIYFKCLISTWDSQSEHKLCHQIFAYSPLTFKWKSLIFKMALLFKTALKQKELILEMNFESLWLISQGHWNLWQTPTSEIRQGIFSQYISGDKAHSESDLEQSRPSHLYHSLGTAADCIIKYNFICISVTGLCDSLNLAWLQRVHHLEWWLKEFTTAKSPWLIQLLPACWMLGKTHFSSTLHL